MNRATGPGVKADPPLPRPPLLFPVTELALAAWENSLGTSKALLGQTDQMPCPAERPAHGKSPRRSSRSPRTRQLPDRGCRPQRGGLTLLADCVTQHERGFSVAAGTRPPPCPLTQGLGAPHLAPFAVTRATLAQRPPPWGLSRLPPFSGSSSTAPALGVSAGM